MKKVYKCSYPSLSISIFANGAVREVLFNTNVQGLGEFASEDSSVQEAIESCRDFKNGMINIDSVAETKVEAVEEPSVEETVEEQPEEKENEKLDIAVFADVKDLQSAIEVLSNEPYNCSVSTINTKKKATAKAAKLGVSFPNMK